MIVGFLDVLYSFGGIYLYFTYCYINIVYIRDNFGLGGSLTTMTIVVKIKQNVTAGHWIFLELQPRLNCSK